MATPSWQRLNDGYAPARKSVEAAIDITEQAQHLLHDATLSDIRSYILHGLMLAACVLLIVELTGVDYEALPNVRKASSTAEGLIVQLVARHAAPVECISSLQVCWLASQSVRGSMLSLDS